jgi:putative ABC transport system ATP-binding protein
MTAEASDILIRAEGVSKIYSQGLPDQVTAVDDISLTLRSGGVAVLQGPSGSGKTSLLSLIACMGRPTAGRITVGDRDVSKLPERFLTRVRRETFGFIFQQLHLIRDLSALENILVPLYPAPVPFKEMRRRGEAVLANLGLERKSRARLGQLSGGEQQRVAIARALIHEPAVIVADEPTAHLDRELAIELLDILQELNRQGKTILIATHDPLVYEHPFVEQIFQMRDGRIEGAGGS